MISLFIMAKNARGVLERAILSTMPHIGELVLVANDCSDDTIKVANEFCNSKKIQFNLIEVTRKTNPELYILDEAETYLKGKPLADEVMTGPFTGNLILADWAGARNLGWKKAEGDQTLFLDADDVIQEASQIAMASNILSTEDIDVIASRYEVVRNSAGIGTYFSYRERLAKTKKVEWRYRIHEGLNLEGKKVLGAVDGLLVKDMKDTLGSDARITNRNLKILYAHGRKIGWENLEPHYLAYLVMETSLTWPNFAVEASKLHLKKSGWKEQRAWVLSLAGESHEISKRYSEAIDAYDKSLQEHEIASAAFKAARCSFLEHNFEAVIKYYIRGLKAFGSMSLFDNNLALASSTKVLYCSALAETGKIKQAKEVVDELLKERPGSMPLKMMERAISERLGITT